MKIEISEEEQIFLENICQDPTADLCSSSCPYFGISYECESNCPADSILKKIKEERKRDTHK